MRAILIDPASRTIEEVEGDFTKNREIYDRLKISMLTTVLFRGSGAIMFLDDNGHVNAGNPCFNFAPYGADYPLAGRALICGLDGPATSDLPADITVNTIVSGVTWLDVESTGQFGPAVEKDGVLHMGQPITRTRAESQAIADESQST